MKEIIPFDKFRILIIEDQFEARALLKNMLMEIGVTQVFEASDGEEGLQFVDAAPDMVDFVISDWNMPNRDGASLLKEIRDKDPMLPFLMVTGRGDFKSINTAKNNGVSGYILKPYSLLQLEAKLRILAVRRDNMMQQSFHDGVRFQ